MHKRISLVACGFLALTWAMSASATLLQQNVGGTVTNATNYFGESFTTPGGSQFNDITFNYFADAAGTTPYASGTLFLLSSLYSGTPNALSSATPGYVATSTGVVNNQWIFAPTVTLQPNTQYFVYTNTTIPEASFLGGNATSESAYFAPNPTTNFASSQTTANYSVSGDAVPTSVPEPGTFALLAALLALVGVLWRKIMIWL